MMIKKVESCDGRRLASLAILLLTGCFASGLGQNAAAQEAEWIWSRSHKKDQVPKVSCFFRRHFAMKSPESGQLTIAADDRYEVYLNGRKVGSGNSSRKLDKYDISKYLGRGRNIIAIKASNTDGSQAAIMARVQVKDRGDEWKSFSTNESWKTHLKPLPLWNTSIYNDSRWKTAQSFGKLGTTVPWDRPKETPVEKRSEHHRFQIARDFQVERVLSDESTGSLIAMTFNEFGQIVAAKENGAIVLINLGTLKKGTPRVRSYCEKITACQGILALNGDLFVSGLGPEGMGLYRCQDTNRDGMLNKVNPLVKFDGEPGEQRALLPIYSWGRAPSWSPVRF